MRGAATLALLLTPRVDAGLAEFVRLCVGFVAGGGSLTILEAGAGRGVLAGARDLPHETERGLQALAELGTRPLAVEPEELVDLLRGAARVIRVADPGRPGTPELLVIEDAYLERVTPDALLRALQEAGQVIRV